MVGKHFAAHSVQCIYIVYTYTVHPVTTAADWIFIVRPLYYIWYIIYIYIYMFLVYLYI
jgi:hypothetical protein